MTPARAAGRIVLALLCVVVLRANAAAQAAQPGARQQKPPAGQTPSKAPKKPPAPLFPRHRRGIYRNSLGANVVDATPQSPPLETDDPGVPDKGEWELNFSTGMDRATDAHRFDVLRADVNYGILPSIGGHELPTQLKFEFPLAGVQNQGEPFQFGPGTAEAGIKFNFYNNEHAGLSIALYPQIEFAAPFGDSAAKGLAEPGQALVLPLLVAKEFHAIIVVANAGVEKPIHMPAGEGDHDSSATYSIAIGRAVTRRLAAMIELRGESTLAENGDRIAAVNVGVIRGVRNVIVYANAGRSISSSGDVPHLYLGFGIKMVVDPKGHNPVHR